MVQLKLYLFGPPRLLRNDQPIEINLRKALALFVYLAVTRQAHSRDALATLFWPEKDQQAARANLRRTLYDLNQLLGESLIDAAPEQISLRSAMVWVDTATFQNYLADYLPTQPLIQAVDAVTLTPLLAAADLYIDDFLAGFTLPDCPAFDDWQFFQREELRRAFATLLQQLMLAHQAQGKFEETIRYARRWLQLDPLEESVHYQLMQLYAQAGQQAAALRQYEECVRILAEELGVPPTAETTALYTTIRTKRFVMQDSRIATPVALSAQPASQDRGRSPLVRNDEPARIVALPAHNLAIQPTPFVGRTQELAEILSRLQEPACRLLTLVGPGGIGKTRLALQAAQKLVDGAHAAPDSLPHSSDMTAGAHLPNFADGIFFVPLQPVSTTSGMIAAIAEATNFRFYTDAPPDQQLVNFLQRKQMLLVLDNMEHLPEGANLVAEILTKAPDVKLLVTSQKALNLYEEWFHPLTGMTLPRVGDPNDHLGATQNQEPSATASDAVQLFIQSARRARADFALDAEQVHVVRICRLVDGMPLALELAATWLKVLPCQKIADEIERGLDILTTRHQNMPVRHRSMHTVLEQSWQLLQPEEQNVLKRLAVFRGGAAQDAAMAVAGASLLTLATLVEKALLRVTTSNRYQMHELLRQFIYRQLITTPDEEKAVRTQHSAYYLHFLSGRAAMLIGKAQRSALDEIGHEIENIRTSWQWATEQNDFAALHQAIEPLYHFYQIQSRYQEGKENFTPLEAPMVSSAATGKHHLADLAPIRILARYAAFCYFLCDYEIAGQALQTCLTQAQTLDDRAEVAFALNFLGQLAVWQGEKSTAKQHLFQSFEISQALGDQSGAASALEKLANLIHATFGEYAESQHLAAQSLAISRKLGRPDWIAYALDTLGFVTFCLGEYHDAEAYYRESLTLFEATGDQYGIAMALGGIGLVLWAIGGEQLGEATASLQASLLICRKIGHQGQVAGRLIGLARIANDLGDYGKAEQLAREGLVIARELGSPVYLAHILYCLGETAYKAGDLSAANIYLLEALQVTWEAGLFAYLVITIFHCALLLTQESETTPTSATQKRAKALEWLTLVQYHPATWHVYKTRTLHYCNTLVEQLSPALVAAARTRGESRTLEEVVAEILSDGGGVAATPRFSSDFVS